MLTVDEMIYQLHLRGHTDIISMWSERRGRGFVVTWNLKNEATIILEIPDEERFWMDFTMNKLASENNGTVDEQLSSFYASYITEWKHKYLYLKVLEIETMQPIQFPDQPQTRKLPEPKDET